MTNVEYLASRTGCRELIDVFSKINPISYRGRDREWWDSRDKCVIPPVFCLDNVFFKDFIEIYKENDNIMYIKTFQLDYSVIRLNDSGDVREVSTPSLYNKTYGLVFSYKDIEFTLVPDLYDLSVELQNYVYNNKKDDMTMFVKKCRKMVSSAIKL